MQNETYRVFGTEAEAVRSMRNTNQAIARAGNGTRKMLAVVQRDAQWVVVSLKTAIQIGAGYKFAVN